MSSEEKETKLENVKPLYFPLKGEGKGRANQLDCK